MDKLDLGWGDPYFLLEILAKIYTRGPASTLAIQNCTYAPDNGEERLLDYVKEITKETTGHEYKYFCITNGATQAINTIMRQMARHKQIRYAVTSHLGYPYYPKMIDKNNLLWHKKVDFKTYKGDINDEMYIVDSPSNPLGEQFSFNSTEKLYKNTVWDAVYHNRIYNACPAIKPAHDVYVGSFSKLLGLTGARVGWFATDDLLYFEQFSEESLYENATVSKPSQKMIIDILNQINLDQFMTFGKNSLDQNRHILHKLSGLLGSDVQEKGMFYCAEVDQKMLDLFDRANIKYVSFDTENKKLIRLNIGQTHGILEKAVKAIEKADRRK